MLAMELTQQQQQQQQQEVFFDRLSQQREDQYIAY